jgi:hypothetical protein
VLDDLKFGLGLSAFADLIFVVHSLTLAQKPKRTSGVLSLPGTVVGTVVLCGSRHYARSANAIGSKCIRNRLLPTIGYMEIFL